MYLVGRGDARAACVCVKRRQKRSEHARVVSFVRGLYGTPNSFLVLPGSATASPAPIPLSGPDGGLAMPWPLPVNRPSVYLLQRSQLTVTHINAQDKAHAKRGSAPASSVICPSCDGSPVPRHWHASLSELGR